MTDRSHIILLTRRQYRLAQGLIARWQQDGAINADQAAQLMQTIAPATMDWRRLSFWTITLGVLCLGVALVAAFDIEWIEQLIARIWNAPAQVKMMFFAALSAALYAYGARRWKTHPAHVYTNQGYFFGGVLASAAAVFYIPGAFNLRGDDASPLLLLLCGIYTVTAILVRSRLIWVAALLVLGSWMGARTGYVSGWGAYWFGMNYPLRFVLFGGLLTLAAYALPFFAPWKRLQHFALPSQVMGMLYLFLSLWILSIFGNYGDLDEWEEVRQIELFHWSLLFALAAGAVLWAGLKQDDAVARGFGLTFLLINLYTRYFEHFWDALHETLFFGLLGISLWMLGRYAQRMWLLVRHNEFEWEGAAKP